MTIGERVRFVRTSFTGANGRHLSLDKFGERIGLKRSALSAMENGDQGVTDQTIMSICREFGVSPEWLRDGIGEPFTPKSTDQEFADLMESAMAEPSGSLKVRLLRAMARLTPEDWAFLENLSDRVLEEQDGEN